MTEEEKKQYIEQNKIWILLQKSYINSFELGIRNAKSMVDHHSDYLKIAEPQLEKEIKYLNEGISNFVQKCNLENIEIPDFAK